MRIGQVAARADVNVQTIRLYERLGLLEKPGRLASGYREYGDEAVTAIRFIKQAKEIGFTLADIKSLMEMGAKGSGSLAEMRELARERLSAIEDRIRKLEAMRDAIRFGLSNCDCPEQFPACVFARLFDRSSRKE
jgi:DNA-binding transcriptional MerR regulator